MSISDVRAYFLLCIFTYMDERFALVRKNGISGSHHYLCDIEGAIY